MMHAIRQPAGRQCIEIISLTGRAAWTQTAQFDTFWPVPTLKRKSFANPAARQDLLKIPSPGRTHSTANSVSIRHFRDCFAILSRVRSAVVHTGCKIPQHYLTTTNQARKRSLDIDFVAFCCQLVSRRLRKAALHCHVAAAEAAFG